MKISSPVSFRQFFKHELKNNSQSTWCAILKPNGKILSLVGGLPVSEFRLKTLMIEIKKHQSKKKVIPICIIKLQTHNTFFANKDCLFFESLQTRLTYQPIELIDYLILTKQKTWSLSNHKK